MDLILEGLCKRMREWAQHQPAPSDHRATTAITLAGGMPAALDLLGPKALGRQLGRLETTLKTLGFRLENQDSLEKWMGEAKDRLTTMGV